MKLIRLILFIAMLTSSFLTASSKQKILTTAEKTNFESTSRYSEVMFFFKQLKKNYPNNIRIESLAKSIEGRDVPLIIMGKPLPRSPKELTKDKRIVIYVQANIHAGEVEGKEAIQMIARDILLKETPDYLKNVVLLICPIFNSDGNEQISKQNRTNQNGPVNGVGVRHNGQMLDLNRDAMKLESPEDRGFVSAMNRWDPSLFIDLHTTNGSYHQEPLTYTWMVNPNGDRGLINYMRDKMMPWMKTTLTEKYKQQNVFYGEFFDQRAPEKGWYYDAVQPRYIVNYVGLRNRLSILNENYVYADFKTRVTGCYNLLRSLLDYVSANKDEIKNMLKEVDAKTIVRGMNPTEKDSFSVDYTYKPTPQPEIINAFEMEPYKDANGRDRLKPTDKVKTVTVPYLADYFSKRSVQFPYAYIITIPDAQVINLLKMHGIKIEKLEKTITIDVQTIKTKELKPAARLNQGHYNNSIKVEYINEKKEFAAGSLIVRTSQRLANVAAYLLEPETDDGLLYWNYWDKYLVPQWGGMFLPYPVAKVLTVQEIPSKELK
ncbi:MAG: M14 family metallopeptidase [Ignavibacteriales bacterium]|nr:M14 family metallopeptidase [Ignavibacteriales bacterium]